MKNEVSVRYPGSASLFQFCKKVLDCKYGGIRVIDQDVGQILGFDPADCSHWKKGKKNIRSIQAMKKIAEHLNVDDRLVVDLASGDIDEKEAFFEYQGYGQRDLDPQVYESAKKEYYKKNASTWTREKEAEFKSYFDIDRQAIKDLVAQIHQKISFEEAPLYLPEVAAAEQSLSLQAVAEESLEGREVESFRSGERTTIKYAQGKEAKPYIRFKIASELGKFFLSREQIAPHPVALAEAPQLEELQTNLFAAHLLTPEFLVRKELSRVDISKDIIAQLAELFWVSKAFMNSRLKEILETN